MNFSRVLFSISILLTFPIECFVSREVSIRNRRASLATYFYFGPFPTDCARPRPSVRAEGAHQRVHPGQGPQPGEGGHYR